MEQLVPYPAIRTLQLAVDDGGRFPVASVIATT
jgi:hypothetical protein